MASKFELAHASLSWIVTQWLVFMTWLIFRVEDTTMMLRSLQSYLLLDSSLGVQDALDAMPDRATFVACLLLVFLPLHAFSSSIDGSAKYHIANLHPTKWGVIIGVWIAAIFLLRPAEVVQFIYFRF
jgi:sterol desaturase/sphingolipid hydroxylase (fatty acid hydroxylase superfamily)